MQVTMASDSVRSKTIFDFDIFKSHGPNAQANMPIDNIDSKAILNRCLIVECSISYHLLNFT